MSILIFVPSQSISGSTRVLYALAEAMCDHKVTILQIGKKVSSFPITDSIEVVEINLQKLSDWYLIFKCCLEAKLIFFSGIQSAIFFVLFFWKKRINYIQGDDYTLFDDMFKLKTPFLLGIYKFTVKFLYNFVYNLFIFNSEWSYDRFCRVMNKKVHKYILTPSVSDVYFSDFGELNQNKTFDIAFFARPHPIKGLDVLLLAFENLKYHTIENLKIIFISSDDPDLFSQFVKDRLFKPKNDIEIAQVLQKSSIFVCSSFEEGYSLTTAEALVSGCCCLVSDEVGCIEILEFEKDYLSFKSKDHKKLSELIDRVLSDTELRKFISLNGISKADLFSFERFKQDSLDILKFLKS